MPETTAVKTILDYREILGEEIDGIDLDSILPEKGFLRDYFEFAKTITDAPSHYHLFCGLAILSAVVGKNIYFPYGPFNLYSNMWIILLAPSSIYRKTTCVNIAKRVLSMADQNKILPNETTPEALVEVLSKQPQGIFCWSEFGIALANFNKDYGQGLKELLTHLYDSDEKYKRTLKKEEIIIENPCISILAGTAADWFISRIRESDVRAGFLARFIYVPAFSKIKRFALPPPADPKIFQMLADELKELGQIKGEMNIALCESFYKDWHIEHEEQLEKETNIGTLSSFYTRLEQYVLKIAMLYEISQSKSLEIHLESMRCAVEWAELLKRTIKRLIEDEFVFDREQKSKIKVLNMIENNPGIQHSKLLKNSGLLKKQLTPVVETLEDEERIRVDKERKPWLYYPAEFRRNSKETSEV